MLLTPRLMSVMAVRCVCCSFTSRLSTSCFIASYFFGLFDIASWCLFLELFEWLLVDIGDGHRCYFSPMAALWWHARCWTTDMQRPNGIRPCEHAKRFVLGVLRTGKRCLFLCGVLLELELLVLCRGGGRYRLWICNAIATTRTRPWQNNGNCTWQSTTRR